MLKGKTAVITGGTRGIGAAIAQQYASMGVNLALIYAGNRQAAEELRCICEENYKVKARIYQCDVSNFTETKEITAEIKKDFKTVHILVNNAGITRDNLILRMCEEEFDAVVETNLKGCFHTIRHLSRYFLKQKSGKIINIASVSGVLGNAGQANYAASKAGIIGLTKTVARELASRGITVNAVAPGFVHTEMTEVLSDQVKEAAVAQIPLGRFGETQDIANTVAFLASEKADYITGQVICVDGGMAM